MQTNKTSELLRRHVGIFEIYTTTRLIYKRLQDDDALKGKFREMRFLLFFGLMNSCSAPRQRVNIEDYNRAWL